MIEDTFVEGAWPLPQEEIGKAVDLAQNSVHDVLSEIPKWEEPIKEMLERDDVPTVADRLEAV